MTTTLPNINGHVLCGLDCFVFSLLSRQMQETETETLKVNLVSQYLLIGF